MPGAEAGDITGRDCATRAAGAAAMRGAGVALGVSRLDLEAGDCARERLERIVAGLLADGERVCVTLGDAGRGPAARQTLRALLDVLAAACGRANLSGRQIELALPAGVVCPAEAWTLRFAALGAGPLYLRTERAAFVACGRAVPPGFWAGAWRAAAGGFVHCSHAPTVGPSTPLPAAEEAGAVLPGLGFAVPAGSAWVTGRVDIAGYADADGNVDWDALTAALESCVDEGDRVHDEARWPTPSMRHDGWRNRRLAILLTGLGELARRRGALPVTRGQFRELAALVARIRALLVARSRSLACRHGVLPALAAGDPTRSLAATPQRAWTERWNRALETAGVRHRNLLAMAPFSVLPDAAEPDPRCFDLLPLLEQADACAARGPVAPGRWKYKEFIELHQRTWAALERAHANRLVAEQV
ncbi:MAG: hypothetical protein R3176_06165 [Woeseiaceae bacterium]|nr:hypothetical protein [Woeseiaceae bacterium]